MFDTIRMTGDAVKSYLTDVHITMLSSIRVTAQNLLDNMTLYKAGYYDIDNSTNFKLSEEAIRAFRTKLSTNYSDTESYTGKIQEAVSGISDISDVSTPGSNGVLELHEQLDRELLNLITEVQNHESSTVTALENSVELLLSSLNTCIAKIGLNRAAIASYESNSFYTDKDVYALANISELFYQQHEDNKEVYDAICEAEQNLKDAAEERETQGVWKTVAGVGLLVVGGVCIVASWGTATPIVAAAEGIVGTGTTIFGVADSAEGAQDIYYGSIGDIDSTAVNDLKDVVFQGNEEAYYLTESVFAFAASAMIPIGQAASAGKLTFRSGATIVAKEGIATAAGAGAQKYTTDLTGNQAAGMIASMATAQGLNGIEAGAKRLAKPKHGDVGADGGAVLNDADVGSAVNNNLNSGLTQSQIKEIVNMPKGSRPDPTTYLSQDYIDGHLAKFEKGASIIMTQQNYEKFVLGNEYIGIPNDGTQFVMPKNYCDEIATKANGNIDVYEKLLGFDEGHFAKGGGLVRIDIKDVTDLNLRIPSGNEYGANSHWIPGGYTEGGVPEAISDLIPNTTNKVIIKELN